MKRWFLGGYLALELKVSCASAGGEDQFRTLRSVLADRTFGTSEQLLQPVASLLNGEEQREDDGDCSTTDGDEGNGAATDFGAQQTEPFLKNGKRKS